MIFKIDFLSQIDPRWGITFGRSNRLIGHAFKVDSLIGVERLVDSQVALTIHKAVVTACSNPFRFKNIT
jgi:hypothetical protein